MASLSLLSLLLLLFCIVHFVGGTAGDAFCKPLVGGSTAGLAEWRGKALQVCWGARGWPVCVCWYRQVRLEHVVAHGSFLVNFVSLFNDYYFNLYVFQ